MSGSRRSIRLPGYDYTQAGAYYVTLVTQGRECLFGEIVDGQMLLNAYGTIIRDTWYDLVKHVGGIELDEFVVMPNHVHGIVAIVDVGAGSKPALPIDMATTGLEPMKRADLEPMKRAGLEPAPTQSVPIHLSPMKTAGSKPAPTNLPEIVRQLKTFSARRINTQRGTPGTPVWQRNYYEHILRDEADLARIRAYIRANPQRWELDHEHPERIE